MNRICIRTLASLLVFFLTVFSVPRGRGDDSSIGGGIGETYNLGTFQNPLAAWSVLLDEIQPYNFSHIRLAFNFQDGQGAGFLPIINYSLMDTIIGLIASRGYRVVLDLHNYHNLHEYCGSPSWIDNWLEVTRRYKDDARVFGFELFNEPYEFAYSEGTMTWYPAIKSRADLALAFADLTDRIRLIDPDRTVIWPDPMSYFQTSEISLLPAGAIRDNVVFAWHGWMVSSAQVAAKIERMVWWQDQYPPSKQWMGEFGIDNRTTRSICQAFLDACVEHGWGFNFWLWSNQHGGAADYPAILADSAYKPRPATTQHNDMSAFLILLSSAFGAVYALAHEKRKHTSTTIRKLETALAAPNLLIGTTVSRREGISLGHSQQCEMESVRNRDLHCFLSAARRSYTVWCAARYSYAEHGQCEQSSNFCP